MLHVTGNCVELDNFLPKKSNEIQAGSFRVTKHNGTASCCFVLTVFFFAFTCTEKGNFICMPTILEELPISAALLL
jgi:hypothetical protein